MVEIRWRSSLPRHARFAMRLMRPGRSCKVLAATSRKHPSRLRRKQFWPRIIELADQGLRDIPELRDDALAFLQHSPPSASRAGSVGETPSASRNRLT